MATNINPNVLKNFIVKNLGLNHLTEKQAQNKGYRRFAEKKTLFLAFFPKNRILTLKIQVFGVFLKNFYKTYCIFLYYLLQYSHHPMIITLLSALCEASRVISVSYL